MKTIIFSDRGVEEAKAPAWVDLDEASIYVPTHEEDMWRMFFETENVVGVNASNPCQILNKAIIDAQDDWVLMVRDCADPLVKMEAQDGTLLSEEDLGAELLAFAELADVMDAEVVGVGHRGTVAYGEIHPLSTVRHPSFDAFAIRTDVFRGFRPMPTMEDCLTDFFLRSLWEQRVVLRVNSVMGLAPSFGELSPEFLSLWGSKVVSRKVVKIAKSAVPYREIGTALKGV